MNLPKGLDRRPLVLSYTMLNTYLTICPYQAAERFIWKNIPFFETDQMREGTAVHEAMENRVGKKVPLPEKYKPHEAFAIPLDQFQQVQCEAQLGITREGQHTRFFGDDVYLRGKLDCSIVHGNKAYLVDWKNGKVREDPFELEVQAVLLKAKYPQLTDIKGQYGWLQHGKMGQLHTLSDTDRTWGIVRNTGDQIAADRKSGNFEKREGPLCKFCPCKNCENHPEY